MKSIANYRTLHITIIWFLLFSFACSAAPNITATATVKPADTPTSTYTPAPTETATATAEPTFTSTSTHAPTPMLTSTTGRVVRSEHFDSLSTLSFGMYGVGTSEVLGGHLVLTEKFSSNPGGDGEAAGRSTFSPQVGNVSVFLFEAGKNAYIGYHFELYENTADGELYRGINLDSDSSGLSLHIDKSLGSNHTAQTRIPVPQFKRDTWYYYSLQVQPDGLVMAKIWERDQPTKVILDRTIQLDSEWAKPGFTFVITSYQGKLEIDEYQEIELAAGAITAPDTQANKCTVAPAGLVGWWPAEATQMTWQLGMMEH